MCGDSAGSKALRAGRRGGGAELDCTAGPEGLKFGSGICAPFVPASHLPNLPLMNSPAPLVEAAAVRPSAPLSELVELPLPPARVTRSEIAAWCLMGGAMLFVLPFHLLPAVLAGLLVYELVHVTAPLIHRRPATANARLVAVMLLATLIVGLLTGAILAAVSFFRSEAGSYPALLQRLADMVEGSRHTIPPWLKDYLPSGTDELRDKLAHTLREHAPQLQLIGASAGRTFAHILIGIVLGGIVSLRDALPSIRQPPLAAALLERARRFGRSFRSVVFAQVRISALNTVFTAVFLLVVLPLFGVRLPLTKTIILITFLAGLVPVVGNLISNSLIVIVGLSHSPQVALAALVFLVVIHKLEYFLNARIIGSQIHSSAWELLLAMLIMESAFGLPGVVAAPIYYAYLKQELVDRGLV